MASEDGAGALSFVSADGLGSVVATTNNAGVVLSNVRYDAWGNLESGTPSLHGFTGREHDETGLAYYRARYYSSKDGRFLSEDPMGFNAGANFYAYVSGNPTNFRDPDGLLGLPVSAYAMYPVSPTQVSPIDPTCFWNCVRRVVGWGTVAAASGAASGAALVPKRFTTPGASPIVQPQRMGVAVGWFVVVAGSVVACGALAARNWLRWRRMSSKPGCTSQAAFLACFGDSQIPAELLRAAFEDLRQGMPANFPVDPSDDLGAVYGIFEEDLDGLVERLASVSRRSLLPPNATSGLPPVRTVEDLVRFVTSLPSQP